MMVDAGYVLEESADGRSLVVTGAWSSMAADALLAGQADGLVLNYSRGFSESGLDFLEGDLGLRRLAVLDRQIKDLGPIERLGDSLEELSVQAAPGATLDFGALTRLRSISGEWTLMRDTLAAVDALQSVTTWLFDESDLHAFRDHIDLQRLILKEAKQLESLSGVGALAELGDLRILLAGLLRDITDVADVAGSLRRFELQACPAIEDLDDVESLVNLHFLGFSDCGDIESLAPVAALQRLETLYAWGSTRVLDGDLSPLAHLPRLVDVRMRERREYRPHVSEIQTGLGARRPG
jgi:hypothetical protein